jgi:hypothetical protein
MTPPFVVVVAVVVASFLLTGPPPLLLVSALEAGTAHPPLDIVYLYLNVSDPRWMQKFRATTGSEAICHVSNSEILMSLLSVQRYFKWVRKVHIVVDDQTFPLDFLEADLRNKVVFHDHTAVMPRAILPTFNSITIEAFLHRVPDLTETFVFLNDDVMFTREITPSNFFNKDNVPMTPMLSRAAHIARHGADMLEMSADVLSAARPYLYPDLNAALLFLKHFGYLMPWYDAHSAHLFTRTSHQHAFAVLHHLLRERLRHKERVYEPLERGGDIQLSILSAYIGIHTGRMLASAPGHAGHTPLVHGISAAEHRIEAHRTLLFSDAYDVVCLQSLYQFSHLEMVQLCQDVKAAWCGGGEACDKFMELCSHRGGCAGP